MTQDDEPDGSRWIDITTMGSPYQHFMNNDGRHRWRPRADPDALEPLPWRNGLPPGSIPLSEENENE